MKVPIERCMVLRQPWAQAVVEGSFPVLIRSQPTNIRGYVGVLTTTSLDPRVQVKDPDRYPMKSIVGAVHIMECLALEGNPRAFLAEAFGEEFARFYPEHFLPEEDPKFVWLLQGAVEADELYPFEGLLTAGWRRWDGEVVGEGVRLLPQEDVDRMRNEMPQASR